MFEKNENINNNAANIPAIIILFFRYPFSRRKKKLIDKNRVATSANAIAIPNLSNIPIIYNPPQLLYKRLFLQQSLLLRC